MNANKEASYVNYTEISAILMREWVIYSKNKNNTTMNRSNGMKMKSQVRNEDNLFFNYFIITIKI